jgi:16S rRNA (adenine1518-N6/adenine1519-N6)-dimethyltransferase
VDERAVEALRDLTFERRRIRVLCADALALDWSEVLGDGWWKMVSNLPYNVAVPVVMELLEGAPQVRELTVTVQREVGERLAAGPGEEQYGAVSVRIAYHAEAGIVRRVPPTVFWPEPNVESVVARLVRRPPPVSTPRDALFRVVDEGFAQRRKTMRNALVRLGLDGNHAEGALAACGLDPGIRAEQLGIEAFACLAEELRGRS